jgi:hypothetical protein
LTPLCHDKPDGKSGRKKVVDGKSREAKLDKPAHESGRNGDAGVSKVLNKPGKTVALFSRRTTEVFGL